MSDDEVDTREAKAETMNDKAADELGNSEIQGRESYASDSSTNDDIEKGQGDKNLLIFVTIKIDDNYI